MSANYTELKSRIAAINFFVRLLSNGNWEVTNCETGKTREFNHDLEYIVESLEAIHARRAAEAVATPEVEAEPVVETVETVVNVSNLSNYDIVTMAEVNVIEDDDTMTVMMAAMVLNDKRTGDATEEEIDEAQGVMVRAVAAELRARGVTFHQDSLQDWICAGEFRGWETAESLADEWGNSDEEVDPDEARRAEYEVWAHKQWLNDMAAD